MVKIEDVTFGAPCWMDLGTSDVTKATAFYSALFGWTTVDTGDDYGNYVIFQKNGKGIAGMMAKSEEMGNAGVPDMWTMYFATEDADATAQKITASGGQVLFPPMDVRDLGRMSIAMDSTGALLGLWQPGQHRGFELAEEPGTPGWFELSTHNFDGAVDFYKKVLGVEIGDMPGGAPEGAEGMPAYQVITIDGEPKAGIMDGSSILPEGIPSNWMIYYVVADTDAAITTATSLGGNVLMGPEDSPYGRFAVIADSTGAAFAVIAEN